MTAPDYSRPHVPLPLRRFLVNHIICRFWLVMPRRLRAWAFLNDC